MAIDVDGLNPIVSGYNVQKINTNFEVIEEALQDGLSRTGTINNAMSTDLDMGDNDIINVGNINAASISVDGVPVGEGIPGPEGPPGTNGDVVGPDVSVDGNVVIWDGVDGSTISDSGIHIDDLAPKNNPTFTGAVSVPTEPPGDTDSSAASTAFVTDAVGTAASTVLATAASTYLAKASNLNDIPDKAQGRENLVVPVYVSTIAALKALDVTKDSVAILTESRRSGIYRLQLQSAAGYQTRPNSEYVTACADLAYYFASTNNALYCWVKEIEDEIDFDEFEPPYGTEYLSQLTPGPAADTHLDAALALAALTWKPIHFPSLVYRFNSEHICAGPIDLRGSIQGTSSGRNTVFLYYGSGAGLFTWNGGSTTNTGTGGGISNVNIYKQGGGTGGYAIGLVAQSTSLRPGEWKANNIYISADHTGVTTSLWDYGFYVDGTLANSAGSRGVRTVILENIRVGNVNNAGKSYYFNQVTHLRANITMDQADGAAAGVTFDGWCDAVWLNMRGGSLAINHIGNGTTDAADFVVTGSTIHSIVNTYPAIRGTCTANIWTSITNASDNWKIAANIPDSGTWTPVLTFATAGDLAVAYNIQGGWWERRGSGYVLDFAIFTSAFTHTTAAGTIQIHGGPAFGDTTTNRHSFGTVTYQGITKAGYHHVVPRTSESPLVSTAPTNFTSLTTGTNTIILVGASPITLGYKVGDLIMLTNHSSNGNNARRLRITALSATTITVAETLTVNAVADTAVTITRSSIIEFVISGSAVAAALVSSGDVPTAGTVLLRGRIEVSQQS